MNDGTDRNDISTESSPGAEDNDNLGTEDNKADAPAVPPTGRGDGDAPAEDTDPSI